MFSLLRPRFVASFVALAAFPGCTANSTAPSGAASATIAGLVSRPAESSGLTVGVIGTNLSAVVERSGYFKIDRVPSGDVGLRFTDVSVDATAQLSKVAPDQFIEIEVEVNGGSATIVSESRSAGKVSLCHREDAGGYHLIDISLNAEGAHRGHGDAKVGEPVPGTQRQVFDSSCRPIGPAVKIVKSTNGEDANEAPGPRILVGLPVIWRYDVTNTGTTSLTNVVVTDDQGVSVNCVSQSPFPAGQVITCTGIGFAKLGQYRNVGMVTASSVTGSVDDSDPSHYLGVTSLTPPPPPAGMTICHIPPGNYDARHTITIDASAWPAHQRHCAQGTCDSVGSCQ